VAHVYKPRYSGDRAQEDLGSRSTGAKKLTSKLGMAVCACHPSCVGGINRKIVIQADPGQK
jgi:hypothetical protein